MSDIAIVNMYPDDIPIRSTAWVARQLLVCCTELNDVNVQRVSRTQLERFNLWASNICVFEHRRASLDYRLRAAPMAKAAFEAELEILTERLLTSKIGQSFTISIHSKCADITFQFWSVVRIFHKINLTYLPTWTRLRLVRS